MNTLHTTSTTSTAVYNLLELYLSFRDQYSKEYDLETLYSIEKNLDTVKQALNSLQYRLYKRDNMNVFTFGCNTEWGDLMGKKFAGCLNLDDGVLSYHDYVVVCDEDTTLKSVEFICSEREELRQLFC